MNTTLLKTALAYASKGWHVFPCQPNLKTPFPKTHGYQDATIDLEKITKWWTDEPNANIGIATGKISGFFVLDVDNKNGARGDETLEQKEKEFGAIKQTVESVTWSKGRHIFFKYPSVEIKCRTALFGDGCGIDIRGDGGYIIAPTSVVAGCPYEWEVSCHPDDIKIGDAPQWLIDVCRMSQKLKDLGDENDKVPEGGRNAAMFDAAVHLKRAGVLKADAWESLKKTNDRKCSPPLGEDELQRIFNSAMNPHPNDRVSYDGGNKADELKKKQIKIEYSKGVIKSTFGNCVEILKADETLNGCFAYNLFSRRVDVIKRLPNAGDYFPLPKPIDDEDVLHVKDYFRNYMEITNDKLNDAVTMVSMLRSYHPVRDYLNGLKWDQTKRVDNWLTTYMGADDNIYTRHVGTMTLVAACARVDQPGCQYDYMLILEGKQGIGKSNAMRVLAGEWFTEATLTDRDRDTIEKMQGKWIIEVPELAVFRKRDVESLKAFITTKIDRERLAYGRLSKDFPRQSIFVGTLNPDETGYLMDSTGNRRFLPVRVSDNAVDLKGIFRDRDQLWAEAYEKYKKGSPLWMQDREVEEYAKKEQKMREVSDDWEGVILDWARGTGMVHVRQGVNTADVWTKCFNCDLSKLTRPDQIRITHALRRVGFDFKSIRINGKPVKKFFIPDMADPLPPIIKENPRDFTDGAYQDEPLH
jgi:predicted P-loop ATPase